MPTIADVARLAQVNPSTVSRVLRGLPEQRVSSETRERILAAAAELRYHPNLAARALRRNRTELIGLIQPGMLLPDAVEFHFAELGRGAEAAAVEAGHWVIRVESGGSAGTPIGRASPEESLYRRLVDDGRVDGLIIASGFIDDGVIEDLSATGLPVVVANRAVPRVPSVTLDDGGAGAIAMEHLASLGHRRVGVLAPSAMFDVGVRRAAGALEAARRSGIEAIHVPDVPLDAAGGADATRALLGLADRPTGILATSILHATGVLEAIGALGLRVPDDVSVVTLPDHPILGHLPPGLTSVRTPLFEVGRRAARLLLTMIDGALGEDVAVPDPPLLVPRASTAAPGRR